MSKNLTHLPKSYKLIPGPCKDCTLEFNCRGNKDKLIEFIKSLGLKECGDGFIYGVVEG